MEANETMARYTEAHKKAILKYQQKAYDNLKFRMKKGFKEEILKPAAEYVGMGLNEFIRMSIIEKIRRDGPDGLPLDDYLS